MNTISPNKIPKTHAIGAQYIINPIKPHLNKSAFGDMVHFSSKKKITGDIDFASKFSEKDLEIVNKIAQYAAKSGTNIYLVGGVVRDMLLGKEANDLDFMVEGDAVKFTEGLIKEIENCKPEYLKNDFGTTRVKIDGTEIDFASTREESYIRKAVPVVRNIGCKMENDVKRRDFTINSIALQLIAKENGKTEFKIVDKMHGIDDLNSKILRTTYKKSFEDDPTRIIRGLKFRLRFGFDYDEETKKIQSEYLKNPPREEISTSRIDTTLRKLFENKEKAPVAFEMFLNEGIYRLYTEKTIAKPEWGKKLSESAEIFEPDNHINFYVSALNDKKTSALLNKYNPDEDLSNYDIYKKMKTMSKEELALYFAITQDENALKYYFELKDIKPALNGEDLLEMGCPKGKAVGVVLEALLKEKLNTENLKTKEDEIVFAKKFISSNLQN